MSNHKERAVTVGSGGGSIASRAVGGQASRSVLSNGSVLAGSRQGVVKRIGGESKPVAATAGNYVGATYIKRQAEASGAVRRDASPITVIGDNATVALAESGDLEAVREHESAASSRAAPQGAVLVDYLRAVLPDGDGVLGELSDWLGEMVQRPVGWRGWYDRSAMVLDAGIVAWCSDPAIAERQGVLVDLSGKACGALGDRLVPFMAWCAERGKVRRLDLAIDDRRELVTYERLAEAIDSGALVTRARGVHWIIGKDAATGERGGWTLYIGSRSSERCVRIYDKRAERHERAGIEVGAPWIRVELEASGDYADALAREVLSGGGDVVIEQINRHMRFTVPSVSDGNRWRHPVAAWWYELLGSIKQGAALVCGEDVPVTVDDLIDYLIRQAAPAFAAVVEATGGDMYGIAQRMLADGAHRLKPRHMVAIREAQAEAVPV